MCVQFVRPPSHDYHSLLFLFHFLTLRCCCCWCDCGANEWHFMLLFRCEQFSHLCVWNWCNVFSSSLLMSVKVKIINRIFMRRTKWKIKTEISNEWITWINSCRTIYTLVHTMPMPMPNDTLSTVFVRALSAEAWAKPGFFFFLY